MADSVSRLTIAIDTSKAKANADALATSLDRTTVAGDKASVAARATAKSYSLAATAAAGYIGALSAGAITSDLQKLQGINSTLGTLTGDLAGQQQFLSTTAKELSADYVVLAGGYSKLLNLYDAGVTTLEQTQALTVGLANASSVAQTGTAGLSNSIFGLSQLLEDVNYENYRQVFEPIPGLNARVAASFGVTSAGLKQLISDGEIAADVMGVKILEALKTYDGAAAARADNIEQTFNRTRTAYLEAVSAFETPISGIAVGAANQITKAFELIGDNADEITTAVELAGIAIAANFGAAQLSRIGALAASQGGLITSINAVASAEVRSAQAKVATTAAELAAAEATAKNAAAKVAAVNATARYLPAEQQLAFVTGQVASAQKASAIATAELTAAQNASSAAASKLIAANAAVTRSTTAMAIAQRAGAGALALIGGPTGAALIAGAGLIYMVTRQTEAEKAAESLSDAMNGLNASYKANATAASQAADATIEAQRASLAALRGQYEKLQAAREAALGESLKDGGSEKVTIEFQLKSLEKQIDSTTEALREFEDANESLATNSALDSKAAEISAALLKIEKASQITADSVQESYDKLFPNEGKIEALKAELAKFKTAFERGVGDIDETAFAKISKAINDQINDLSGFSDAQRESAKVAEEYAERVKSALDEAFPERAIFEEQEAQLKLLRDEMNKGGPQAELYASALYELEKAYELTNADRAAEKVKKFTDIISQTVDDPFESYRQDIALLEEALDELPDKAGQIHLALSNLDFNVVADLTVIESSDNAATTQRAYQEQLKALNEFHQLRNVSEEDAQQNIIALARSYADQLSDIHDEQFAKLNSFNEAFAARPDQAGLNLQVSYDGAKAEAAAIQDASLRASTLESIAQTHQAKLSEIVRAGEATRAQIAEASGADRVAGFINANQREIDAATNLVGSILSLRANREKIEADQALSTARNLEAEAQAARKVYEKSGLETDRLLAEQAEKRAKAAELTAKREFEQQKKAQLQQARLSQLLAIMNAYATGGNWLTGAAFAVTAGIATQQVIDDIKAQQFNGGSSSLTNTAATATANYPGGNTSGSTDATVTAGTTERIVMIVGDFRSEEDAMFEVGRQQRRLYEEGYINSTPDGLDFGNVPDRVVRLT